MQVCTMAVSRYKSLISHKVTEVLKSTCNNLEINPRIIESLISIHSYKKGTPVQFKLPLKPVQSHYGAITEEHFNKVTSIKNGDGIHSVVGTVNSDKEAYLSFNLNTDTFVKNILNDNEYFNHLETPAANNRVYKEKVVIEFSSPNVAKPFHMGHFRSTIIGNFLSNIYEHLSYDVVRLTYLGDWGTQFGLLQVGLNKLGYTDKDFSTNNPIELLFKAYVSANKASETDSTVREEAKEIFNSMEHGKNEHILEKWKTIRNFTTDELKSTYDRLGVKFNDYDWESNYPAGRATPILNDLKERNFVSKEDGKLVFKLKNGSNVTLLKTDGSSLYLTRDIVAAMVRSDKYKFDKVLYVTDFSQHEHFVALDQILNVIDSEKWRNKIEHVKYGRIRGLSTRKGEVVFLRDILDEAKDIMREKQKASPTTKSDLDENTTDILGVTAVIVNDLKQRRLKDYEFNWDSALQMKGDTGIKLQYTHCRLVSLEENCNVSLPDLSDPLLLQEVDAVCLVQEIARFDEIVQAAFEKQESYVIVNYLFKLCNTISRALKSLPVKNASRDTASQRLLLFHYARIVLNRGMKILGLKPLDRM